MKTRMRQKRSIFSQTETSLVKSFATGQMKNRQSLKNAILRVSFHKYDSRNGANEWKKQKRLQLKSHVMTNRQTGDGK
jgi:hypothetical protein